MKGKFADQIFQEHFQHSVVFCSSTLHSTPPPLHRISVETFLHVGRELSNAGKDGEPLEDDDLLLRRDDYYPSSSDGCMPGVHCCILKWLFEQLRGLLAPYRSKRRLGAGVVEEEAVMLNGVFSLFEDAHTCVLVESQRWVPIGGYSSRHLNAFDYRWFQAGNGHTSERLAAAMVELASSYAPSEDDEEPDFRCPISHELMTDPVTTADGHTYDRRHIQRWFDLGNRTSPLGGHAPLAHFRLSPNVALREAMFDAPGSPAAAGIPPDTGYEWVDAGWTLDRTPSKNGAAKVDPGGWYWKVDFPQKWSPRSRPPLADVVRRQMRSEQGVHCVVRSRIWKRRARRVTPPEFEFEFDGEQSLVAV